MDVWVEVHEFESPLYPPKKKEEGGGVETESNHYFLGLGLFPFVVKQAKNRHEYLKQAKNRKELLG